jgi:hypothetical protein
MEKFMILDEGVTAVEHHGSERYWFDSVLQKDVHDNVREYYLYHAQAINEVIRPYIINSSKKQRWTKGLGQDTYYLPHLMARMSTEAEQKKDEIPYHILSAEIVNPNNGVAFWVDMPLGQVANLKDMDFAVFAELCKNATIQYEFDKGRIAKEGIIV